MRGDVKKLIVLYLVMVLPVIGAASKVYAGFSPSEIPAVPGMHTASDFTSIQKVLEVKMVKERLEKLGFTQEEIQARINQLDPQEIHKLALNLDQLKVGGDGFEIVIALLVIAILVVVLIKVTSHQVIIK